MHLKRTPQKSGRINLSIVDGYYDKNKKHTRQYTIENLGYLDELERIYDNPIAFFTQRVDELKKQKAKQNAPLVFEFSHKDTMPADIRLRKNFGYAVLSKIYHQQGLHTFFANRQRHASAQYDANAIMKMLVFQRLLAPASKKKTFENKEYLFESSDFSLDDVYHCLSFLNNRKEALQLWLHQHIKKHFNRSDNMAYYVVTDYYFDIGRSKRSLIASNEDDKRSSDDLRKKAGLPPPHPESLVQMGLLMDSSGVPISYQLFPRDIESCLTYKPNFYQNKQKFGISKVIVTADRTIFNDDDIWHTLCTKDGYVFSIPIRDVGEELRQFALDEDGYKWMGTEYKLKSRLKPRTIHISEEHGNVSKKLVYEKQVVFYSVECDRRDKAERALVIAKAQYLIANPDKCSVTISSSVASYIKNLKFDKKTGIALSAGAALMLDLDKIRKDEALDGYCVIVTSQYKESDTWVINTYQEQWRTKESFRVIKGELESLPCYFSKSDHIETHFLICFISLIIGRLLETTVKGRHSIGDMLESLSKAECTYLQQSYYILDYCDEILKDIGNIFDIDFTKRIRGLDEIKDILASSKR